MRTPVRIFILLLCVCIASCTSRIEEKKKIKKTWDNYSAAIRNSDGEDAAKYIDRETVQYYDRILELIRTADSNTVALLRIDQKILVLGIRHIATRQTIAKLDGGKLFAFSVTSGIFSSTDTQATTLENIIVNGRKATAHWTNVSLKKSIATIPFSKEDGKWKINFVKLYNEQSARIFEFIMKESEKTEDELVIYLLRKLNDQPPINAIWHPVK